MKKLALLACSMLFVSSVAFAADSSVADIKDIKAKAQEAVKANAKATRFPIGEAMYGISVIAGVITITQGNGSGSTVTVGTVGTI